IQSSTASRISSFRSAGAAWIARPLNIRCSVPAAACARARCSGIRWSRSRSPRSFRAIESSSCRTRASTTARRSPSLHARACRSYCAKRQPPLCRRRLSLRFTSCLSCLPRVAPRHPEAPPPPTHRLLYPRARPHLRDGVARGSARGGNFWTKRLQGWARDGLLGEGLEHGRSATRGVGGHVRHAELRAVDRGRIPRADAGGGEFGDARLDGGDVCGVEVAPQFEGGIDGGVAAAAARAAAWLEAA